jgi:hypothetical protein
LPIRRHYLSSGKKAPFKTPQLKRGADLAILRRCDKFREGFTPDDGGAELGQVSPGGGLKNKAVKGCDLPHKVRLIFDFEIAFFIFNEGIDKIELIIVRTGGKFALVDDFIRTEVKCTVPPMQKIAAF